jgi:hypothetical protein
VSDASRRWGGVPIWIPVVILAVALVGALAVLALQTETEYDASTPEGTVQRYVRAVVDGDHRAALHFLDERLGCTTADFRWSHLPPSTTVRLVDTGFDGADKAEVDLVVSEYSGPFGGGYEFPTTIALERRDGAWLIVDVPWPVYYCEGEAPG